MDNLTRQLAHFAATLRYDDIPESILMRARQSLVDTIGCGLGGQNCEAARIALAIADGATPARGAGRILGSVANATAQEAAFINTAMIRYLDFNDSWHAGHPSDILGGLLAMASSSGASGKRFLSAMVAAYEVVFRLIPPTQMREKGWDQGFCVGLAAVCGLGHLLSLDTEQIGHALAITAVANVPMRATRAGNLSLWKGSATAFAVRNAVYATQLAAGGMTGPEKPFEGRHGLMEQITGTFAIDPFPAAGGDWLLPWVRLKYWPVEYNAQAGVWASLKLREQMTLDEIAKIDIATYWSAWHEIGSEPAKWDPQTRETADHSLPYIFGRALTDGTITVGTFDSDRYLDPTIRPLMAKISVAEDDSISALFPHKIVMRVAVESVDGRRVTIEPGDPRGDCTNPMDDGEIAAKFRLLAEPILGETGATRVLNVWNALDRVSDMATAMDALVRQP
ncbi:MAG: MmgE/PrpD family protein [Rhodospirillales bacterium]